MIRLISMKKVAGVILLPFILLFAVFVFTSHAQESVTSNTDVVTITPEPSPTVEYNLAYPGILPDSPLHFLKAIRDRIIGFLINDPLKKAEFNLLTSDKRLYASQLLLNKNKQDLAFTTLSKSNNYLHGAVSSVSEAAKAGKNVDIVLSNLKMALIKRGEVFLNMENEFGKEFTAQLQGETKRLNELQKIVTQLRPE